MTEEELIQVFKDYDVVPPKAVKLFPMKTDRSSSGLLEFETTAEAVAAVMACNHAAIESPGNYLVNYKHLLLCSLVDFAGCGVYAGIRLDKIRCALNRRN